MTGSEGFVERNPVVEETEGGTTVEVCSWGRMRRALRKVKVEPDLVAVCRKLRESSLKMYTADACSVSSCSLILQSHTDHLKLNLEYPLDRTTPACFL